MSSVESLNAVESIVAEAFAGTDVVKLPLTGPDNAPTNVYGLFLERDGKHVNRTAVTKGYLPHTVDDIRSLAAAASIGFDALDNPVVTTEFDGENHRVVIGPSREYRREVAGTDTVWPRVMISGGYSGRGFRAQAGMWRDACSNLQMDRMIRGTSVSIRHTQGMRGKIDMLVDNFRDLAATWDGQVDMARTLANTNVQLSDFIATLYPMPEKPTESQVKRFRKRAQEIVDQIIRDKRTLGERGTGAQLLENLSVWDAVNGVTGYVQHRKSRNGRPDSTARAFMAFEDKESDEAWALAHSLAS